MSKVRKLSDAQKAELEEYSETNSDEIYDNSSADSWIEKDYVENFLKYPNRLYVLEGNIDEDRFTELENGAEPSKKEIEIYNESVLDDFFYGNDYMTGGWFSINQVTMNENLSSYVLFVSTGGSMMYDQWIHGVFDTEDEAYESFEKDYISRVL